jgi:uncharacterized membrane protein
VSEAAWVAFVALLPLGTVAAESVVVVKVQSAAAVAVVVVVAADFVDAAEVIDYPSCRLTAVVDCSGRAVDPG